MELKKILKGKNINEIQESLLQKLNEDDLYFIQYKNVLLNIRDNIEKIEEQNIFITNLIKKQKKNFEDLWTKIDKVKESQWNKSEELTNAFNTFMK
jgi:GTP-binding protein EngB required for normal cell division